MNDSTLAQDEMMLPMMIIVMMTTRVKVCACARSSKINQTSTAATLRRNKRWSGLLSMMWWHSSIDENIDFVASTIHAMFRCIIFSSSHLTHSIIFSSRRTCKHRTEAEGQSTRRFKMPKIYFKSSTMHSLFHSSPHSSRLQFELNK